MKKGDLVLAHFPFTDLTSAKKRPALVLAADATDAVLAFITSQLHHIQPIDVVLLPNASNGLKVRSAVRTTKLATLKRTLIEYKLGELTAAELQRVNDGLRLGLQL